MVAIVGTFGPNVRSIPQRLGPDSLMHLNTTKAILKGSQAYRVKVQRPIHESQSSTFMQLVASDDSSTSESLGASAELQWHESLATNRRQPEVLVWRLLCQIMTRML